MGRGKKATWGRVHDKTVQRSAGTRGEKHEVNTVSDPFLCNTVEFEPETITKLKSSTRAFEKVYTYPPLSNDIFAPGTRNHQNHRKGPINPPPRFSDTHTHIYIYLYFSTLAGIFDGSPPATRRRGGCSETLAGRHPVPARAAPPATLEWPPAAAAPVGAVTAAGGRSVLPPGSSASRGTLTGAVCEAAQKFHRRNGWTRCVSCTVLANCRASCFP